jgi:hypothetical protein
MTTDLGEAPHALVAAGRPMRYMGCEVPSQTILLGSASVPIDVPRLSLFDHGETVGDYAVIDGDVMQWDGLMWVRSLWQVA